MKKIALILAPGFEEIEAITPIDVLRRAGFTVDVLGLFDLSVKGSHDIVVQADRMFDGSLIAYDMVVLPGGLPGATHLRDHAGLIEALQEAARAGRQLAAICAAPIVLAQAGLLTDKQYTCYPGTEQQISSGQFTPQLVVVDGEVITSRGAGTSLAFAYQLVEILGGDAQALAQGMMYQELFK